MNKLLRPMRSCARIRFDMRAGSSSFCCWLILRLFFYSLAQQNAFACVVYNFNRYSIHLCEMIQLWMCASPANYPLLIISALCNMYTLYSICDCIRTEIMYSILKTWIFSGINDIHHYPNWHQFNSNDMKTKFVANKKYFFYWNSRKFGHVDE